MIRIEPLEKKHSIPDIINNMIVNDEIQVNANRIGSFKATVNRINSKMSKTENKILFSYSDIKNDYCTAKRIG